MADGGDNPSQTTRAARQQRCVVWVPPEGAAPTRLLAGLSQRHVPAAVVLDAPAVMLQLADGPVTALIVVEPDRQPHRAELLTAAARYYPRLALWQYRAAGEGLTRLQTASAPPAARPAAQRTPAEPIPPHDSTDTARKDAASPPRPDHAPRGNGSGPATEPGPRPAPAPSVSERDTGSADHHRFNEAQRAPLISPEELDMLLGPLESLEQEPPRP